MSARSLELLALAPSPPSRILGIYYQAFFDTNRHLIAFCYPAVDSVETFTACFEASGLSSLHSFFDAMKEQFIRRKGINIIDMEVNCLMGVAYPTFTLRCAAMGRYVVDRLAKEAAYSRLSTDERLDSLQKEVAALSARIEMLVIACNY
jgi:hypothetical protein